MKRIFLIIVLLLSAQVFAEVTESISSKKGSGTAENSVVEASSICLFVEFYGKDQELIARDAQQLFNTFNLATSKSSNELYEMHRSYRSEATFLDDYLRRGIISGYRKLDTDPRYIITVFKSTVSIKIDGIEAFDKVEDSLFTTINTKIKALNSGKGIDPELLFTNQDKSADPAYNSFSYGSGDCQDSLR